MMRNIVAAWLLLLPVCMGATNVQCKPVITHDPDASTIKNSEPMKDTLVITIGGKDFTATLLDNPSAAAFKAMLPLTVTMTELNGNEKYVRLPKQLPVHETGPGKIMSGDLMLYGANTFVLFYASFPTTYRYTRLGKIANPSGLAAAAGSGNVKVRIAVK